MNRHAALQATDSGVGNAVTRHKKTSMTSKQWPEQWQYRPFKPAR